MPDRLLKILYRIIIFHILLVLPGISKASPNVSIPQPFIDTQLCVGSPVKVNFAVTPQYFDTSNTITIQLSDTNGSFSNPVNIGFAFISASYFINCLIPSNITPGTNYRIRVIASSPRDTSYDNGKPIRISSYPILIVNSNSPVCPGSASQIDLYGSSIGGASNWKWTGPNNFIATAQNAYKSNVQFSDSGKYILTADKYGCQSKDSVFVKVMIPPKAYIIPQGIINICVGDNLVLTDSSNVPGVRYSWKGPSNFSSVGIGSSAFIYVNIPSKYTGHFVLTASVNGGCYTKDSVWVNILPKPDSPSIISNSPICMGDSIKFSASSTTSGASFVWRGPNGYSSILQNPVINNANYTNAGYYFAAAKHPNGCKSLESKLPIVIGTPVSAPTISGNNMLCRGDSLLLIANSPNTGIYQWVGPNNNTLTLGKKLSIGNITTADAGIYSVTLNNLGCTSAPATINMVVTDVPDPKASSNAPICDGNDLTLHAQDIPNAIYSWTGPNGFTSSQQNPLLPSSSTGDAGIYYVRAQILNCNNSSGTYVVINPIPVITAINSNGPVCVGSELNLYAESNIPGSSFTWRGPNAFYATTQNPTITIGKSGEGLYYAQAIAKGCISSEDSLPVQTKELPAVPTVTNNGPLNTGEKLKLHAECATVGSTLTWSGPLGFTSSDPDIYIEQITDDYKGPYSVTAMYNGCISTNITNVVVNALKKSSFILFPNPNNGNFKISGYTKTNSTVFYEIVNLAGQIIYRSSNLPVHKKFSTAINANNLSSGPYILYLSTVGESQAFRFIVD